MAQTTEQWYAKISKFVPSWVFEKKDDENPLSPAVFMAIAAIFSQVEQDGADAQSATFIDNAVDPILDLLGNERSKDRLIGELDPLYRTRIKRITSQSDIQSITDAVNLLLNISGCIVLESPQDNPYCDRGAYCSRDSYITGFPYGDFFTIVVPKQTHPPYSFSSRSLYASRRSYAGTFEGSSTNYASIIALVDSMKAFGVMYRIVESTRSVLN